MFENQKKREIMEIKDIFLHKSRSKTSFRPVLSNLRPAGRMRPADRFCAAREGQQKSTKIIVKQG